MFFDHLLLCSDVAVFLQKLMLLLNLLIEVAVPSLISESVTKKLFSSICVQHPVGVSVGSVIK